MREFVSDAIVLDKEPNGELDSRVALFTKKFGRLTAKARSARKITSKLATHLDAGTVSTVRLVEKNGLQVVDALKCGTVETKPSNLYFLNQLMAEGETDLALWQVLTKEKFSWQKILKLLGWDPHEARCALCGKSNPALFTPRNQEFFCEECVDSHHAEKELLYIGTLRD